MRKLSQHIANLFVLFFLLMALPSFALGVKDFTFSHLGTLDGLSSQRVYSLHKTKDNAVWWTTKYGVDRSNGAVVKNYPIGERSMYSSFAGRVVRFAHSTCNNDDTYVFDNTGCIYLYDRIQDRFDLVANVAKTLNLPVLLNDVLVTSECVWLGMREGVYQLLLNENNKMKDMGIRYFTDYILPYGNNQLLFCTHDGIFDIKDKKWSDDHVITGFYDQKMNNLWIGTFNEGVKVIKKVTEGKAKSGEPITLNVPRNPVRAITPYDNRTILIGIDGFGVYQALRSGGDVKPLFSANEGPNGVLHGNGVYDIIVDSWNNIIVGSYSGGIDVARPVGSTKAGFRHVMNHP
jgi:hypothetical protein